MIINIITSIDIDKDESEYFSKEEIDNIYNDFRSIIKNAYESGDLTDFSFVNNDTRNEIENEVEE